MTTEEVVKMLREVHRKWDELGHAEADALASAIKKLEAFEAMLGALRTLLAGAEGATPDPNETGDWPGRLSKAEAAIKLADEA